MQIANPTSFEGAYEEEEEEEEEQDVIDLTIFPSTSTADRAATETNQQAENEESEPAPTPAPEPSNQSPIQRFFTAISACSNLHPDELLDDGDNDEDNGGNYSADEEDPIIFQGSVGYTSTLRPGRSAAAGDDTLPPPVPGSGGWITAENVGEFFDEQGNWRDEQQQQQQQQERLGPGAGTVRTRERDGREDDAEQHGNDENDGSELMAETKWRRTG